MFEFFRDFLNQTPSRSETAQLALLEAAIEEFGTRSLEGARTREIAARAGQNLGAISYYYQSKEGLYRAVAEVATGAMRRRLEPVFARVDAFLAGVGEARRVDVEQVIPEVLALLEPLMQVLLLDDRIAPFSLIVIREQIRPTPVFDVYFERLMRPAHERLTRLVALTLGVPAADDEAITKAHALFGQLVIFRGGREMLKRRTGWTHVAAAQQERMLRTIRESIAATLRGHALAPRT